MAEGKENLDALFATSPDNGLPPDILGELESMLRLHSTTPKELFYKWESYCLKMGSEETKMNLDTIRMFKKDVQDAVERESRGKHSTRISDKRPTVSATPRNASSGNVFGMLDDLIPNTPLPRTRNHTNGTGAKRKSTFETPAASKVNRSETNGAPATFKTPVKPNGLSDGTQGIPFSERQNAGQIIETINDHLPAAEAPIVPFADARVKVLANTDLKKFSYKPMSMRQSESSEVLDERIDEYTSIVQKAHGLEDSAFGNPAAQSTSEIVAVGRIACDTPESRLTAASLVLETSRRMGAGVRVPLKMDSLSSFQVFPGRIIAAKGSNASGEYFTISELLSIPFLPPAASVPTAFESINARLGGEDESSSTLPLNFIVSCGPYTADDNLDFEPLKEICHKAEDSGVDTLILTGPFLDIEHPLLAAGDFDVPGSKSVDPQTANMGTLFRSWITPSLQKLASAIPSITILLVPSVRDALNRHVSWPEDMLQSRKELGIPKQARLVSNPITLSLNETVFGISTQDILYELRQEELSSTKSTDLLTRLPRHLIEQRHFFPLYPPTSRERLPKAGGDRLATGACLDLGYMKLGEWWNVRPDVLITPSALPPFVKVVESVLVINPGPLSKRRAAGTYAQMSLQPRILTAEEQAAASVAHKTFERARVDIVRI